ncbi:MAG: hypothetical protein J5998_00940, partial [Clostridia bacterium]|nr:hypothetical protein [Clostridia bacterium]
PRSARAGLRALRRRAVRNLFAVSEPACILLDEAGGAPALRRARRLARRLGRCAIEGYRDDLGQAALRRLAPEEAAFVPFPGKKWFVN